jgi:hypothetical protein
MKKEIVPYELALKMKKLKSMDKGFRHGFNEKTFAYFVEGFPNDKLIISSKPKLYSYEYNGGGPELISAPTWQSAFRWFREKYDLHYQLVPFFSDKESHAVDYYLAIAQHRPPIQVNTFEEAELACLEKLIEIVEQNL